MKMKKVFLMLPIPHVPPAHAIRTHTLSDKPPSWNRQIEPTLTDQFIGCAKFSKSDNSRTRGIILETLRYLDKRGPVFAEELAEHFGLSSYATGSRLVSAVRRGWATKKAINLRGVPKKNAYSISPAGKKMLAENEVVE